MSKIVLTPEQQLAVSRRSALLVSAAAGSGKTRVLTKRLISYITDETEPCSINEFLVITFTRAAAAELRSRILEELSRISGEDPSNRRLRNQNVLCYQAQIGTIHSFCTTIIRENCHSLGLSPDFAVGDEEKCRRLKLKSLDRTLETAYETMDENPGFAALAAEVGIGRDDSRLAKTVMDLHEKMQSHPYPEKWARQQTEQMQPSAITDIAQTPWGALLMERAVNTADYWSARLDRLWLEICENEQENAPLIKAYGESIGETMDAVRSLPQALKQGWDKACRLFPIPFPNLKPLRNYEFEDRKNSFSLVRDGCKKAMNELALIFDSSSDKMLRDLEKTFPAMRALLDLTLEFDRRYSAEKRRCGLLDFSDLEHFAVRLLCDEQTQAPTLLAKEISLRYREILVDEFQDVNAVQDLIFRSVSRDQTNIFTVGDVKQSIYRFRLAEPAIFLRRLETGKRAEDAGENEFASVLLRHNFRSDRRILAACNSIFSSLMSKELGDIDYGDDCALYAPDDAPEARGEVRFTVISALCGDEEERPDKIVIEADYVAGQIRQLIEEGSSISDGGALRTVRYGDIAVLLRSPGSSGAIYKSAFAKAGIPVSAQQGSGFFTSPEIVVLIALLSIIDNPHRDVPLTAVLSSPVFGFTADELSEIRATNKKADFFTAMGECALANKKCADFIEALGELRDLSYDLSVHELISHIYDTLELPALWTAALGSRRGTANLLAFSELAGQFENGGFRGVSEFLARLEIMQERGVEPQVSGSGHDCVSIMSIHKAKGLEFPVVFLADTARRFNKMDLANPVLIHSDLGLGGKLTDLDRGIEYPSLAHRAVKMQLNRELLSEEMRVLYVALTRAKEKLFISCTASDPEEFIKKNSAAPDSELLRTQQSMAHWVVSAAVTDAGRSIDLLTAFPDKASEETAAESEAAAVSVDSAELADLRKKLSYGYPHKYAASLPSKLTATSLTKDAAPDDSQPLVRERGRIFRMPDISEQARRLTAAERGIATHTVMQFIDFDRCGSPEEIKNEVERIHALGMLDDDQTQAVDTVSILKFFKSDMGKRILAADKVLREFRFSLLVNAADFYPEAQDEKLLLQGVVDCCIEEDGELTVVDYKTDYVTAETLPELAEHYKPQLQAYALALSRITGKPVKGCVLCFLRNGLFAQV